MVHALATSSFVPFLLALVLASGQQVTLPGASSASLERPAGDGPFPAVVLVDGWWSESAFERSATQRLLAAGFVVLRVAPDRGQKPVDRDATHAAMAAPAGLQARETLGAAVRAWGGWNEKAAEDSWARALEFLRKRLPARP